MSAVKKFQEINIKVDPKCGDLALAEIRDALFKMFSLRNKVVPVINFPGDPIEVIQVQFFATNEKAAEIEETLLSAYQFC
ncbi:MAG: hypothetical protein ACLTXM_11990 [Enterococcus sp.]